MELKYIWIRQHRILEDFQLNFDHTGEHDFVFKNGKLSLINKLSTSSFFGKKISALTVIAGRNGAGKSSFCEAVLYATATLQESSFGVNFVFEGIVCFGKKIYIQKDIKISNKKELLKANYEIILFNESPFEQEMQKRRVEKEKYLGHLGFVYYSNTFDLKSYQRENNLSNISTTYKIYNDKFYSSFVQSNDSKIYNKETGDTFIQFTNYSIQEDYRNLKFILDFPHLVEFISEHNFIVIYNSYSGNNKFIPKDKIANNLQEFLEEKESEILGEIAVKRPPEGNRKIELGKKKTIELMLKLYRLNLTNLLLETETSIELSDINSFIYLGIFPPQFNHIFSDLMKIYEKLLKHGQFIEEYNYFDYNELENKDWRFYCIQSFSVPLDSKSRKLINKLIELEKQIAINNTAIRISNFSIQPYLSAGELSFLSIFARLYDVIINYKNGIYDKRKLIIFLDEPEIGFHPNWSKKLIKWLVEFLSDSRFEMKFQVIITTHSPYVLSDIPRENVKLITRKDLNKPVVIAPIKDTFGANIYDLLADSFFMQDGFIGEYAKNTINEVYKDILAIIEKDSIHKPKYSEQEIKSIIEIIGEPLIKRQLFKLYDIAFKTNYEEKIIDEQIKRLQELKNRKNDSNR
jgi:predicted ATP-binding protein involved in virulence